jgi:hypothetical protein
MTSWGAYVSTNGFNWTPHQIADGYVFQSVVFGGGTFVAGVGGDGSIATSTNGRDWVVHRPRPQVSWGKIEYANGAFWIVGPNEAIIRSAQIHPAIRARKTGAGVELTIQVSPGQTYRLQRATSLGAWTDFQTFTPQTETTTLTDPATSQSSFYRILSP